LKYDSISAELVDLTEMVIDKKTHAESFKEKKNEREAIMIIKISIDYGD
jgi:hypothetical protein